MKLVIGCDEAAYSLKNKIKEYLMDSGHVVTDVGVYNEDPSLYPDTADKLCKEITEKNAERGILLCGTGIGMAITANKVPGIRAAVGHDLFSVERLVKSNDCQVLCMGARIIAFTYAKRLLDEWLNCQFSGGGSAEKVKRIMEIERQYKI